MSRVGVTFKSLVKITRSGVNEQVLGADSVTSGGFNVQNSRSYNSVMPRDGPALPLYD